MALITGAARRVGAVIARKLHGEGYRVVIHHRSSDDEAAALVAELCGQRPESATAIKADLLESGAPERVVAQAREPFGRLDVVINNASMFYGSKVGEVTRTQWDELMGVNLRVPFFLVQAAAPHLAESGNGVVINLVDIYADRPLKGFPVYSMAKAALVMATKTLARELAPDVRVNAVAPGAILWPEEGTSDKTQRKILARTALGRRGDPEDIAGAVLYLVRDASYVTGQILAVDGGRTLSN